MMCYKDMTFCSAVCNNKDCSRQFTKEQSEGAKRWWSHDPENVPVAFSDFSDTCEEYDQPVRRLATERDAARVAKLEATVRVKPLVFTLCHCNKNRMEWRSDQYVIEWTQASACYSYCFGTEQLGWETNFDIAAKALAKHHETRIRASLEEISE